MASLKNETEKVPFEVALDRTGFGLYNCFHTLTSGLAIVSFGVVAFSSTVVVPASACELGTTRAQQGVLAAAPVIGSILGAFAWGYLGDTRGRRRMLVLSLSLALVFNTLASLAVNWIMLMLLQFTATFMSCGKYTLSMTLLSECVPRARRSQAVLVVASVYLLTQGIMAAIAIPIIPLTFSYPLPFLGITWTSWRLLLLAYSVPSALCLPCVLMLQESPKYLLLRGEEGQALDVLRAIYRANHRGCAGGEEFDVKRVLAEKDTAGEQKSKRDQIVPLFRAPLIKYTIIMAALFVFQQVGSFVIWLPRIANQYVNIVQSGDGANKTLCGIIRTAITTPPNPDAAPCSLNVPSLVIVIAVCVFQSTVNLIISLVVNRTGRRNMVIFGTSAVGLCGVVTNLVPNAYGSGVLFVCFCLGILAHGLYTAMAVALFPTSVRAMAVSLVLAAGRMGVFAAVQILNLLLHSHCEAGFYVFATLFASSAIVALFLPDDRMLMKASAPGKNEDTEKEQSKL
ncbi:unnamed protein product [Plutella xylostella]|uniref:(diamondback moth) hypothetical protein n=1 Tax=Plutella xylostella TaxID=51655 RepID=A0A8S4G744_PLUXY|nr:unnamed protein product [Plutella xylostella]